AMPPLRTMLDTALGYVDAKGAGSMGLDGTGIAVGVADTGIDVTHGDFLDASGHTRVAWLLDLSSAPRGVHASLEGMYGQKDATGNVLRGAVWSGDEIDQALAAGGTPSQDPAGHGTLVASCAAGNGERGRSRYVGVAPSATLLVARITDASEDIANDDMLRGVGFLMDRAAFLRTPVVVNLSIGTDFGPHDGTTLWEEALASHVGPAHPGSAIVVAAGNSGSIADTPIHQNVHVSPGTRLRVPVLTQGSDMSGGVQIWVAIHGHASLKVGLDSPSGTWIDLVDSGRSAGSSDQKAGIYNGSGAPGSQVPVQSNGAIVAWQGSWASGTYYVTLEGSATADLYLQATGDAAIAGVTQVGFADGVREGTIGLPATHPELIGVGCTINKPSWTDLRRRVVPIPPLPLLDTQGGEVNPLGVGPDPLTGQPCWFSGAGPTLTGLFKPDIMAPGAAIVGALSAQAAPSSMTSIFASSSCQTTPPDPTCLQVDSTHAVAMGTSFSTPIVAGAIALMLQYDPTLTQDDLIAALQGGAHPLRGPSSFADQAGPGELDVLGAIDAIDRLRDPKTALPSRSVSWMSLGDSLALADGSTPIQAILELRAPAAGAPRPPPADGFDPSRLTAYALVDGAATTGVAGAPVRRGPGVWTVTVQPPAGLGGSSLTVGARFDGVEVVDAVSVPIAADAWTALYPATVQGGCSVGGAPARRGACAAGVAGALIALLHRRRANRREAQRLRL
ncbi:MAG: S8 family serine peptidase, partial [Polyangiaceae bacterium]